MLQLHKKGVRAELAPRREPYWLPPLDRGRYLGYRRLEDGGTWVARMRKEDGTRGSGSYAFKALGRETPTFGYTEAKRAAEEWFKSREAGISDDPPTVREACEEYIEELESDGRGSTAYDTRLRFKAHVYDHPIARTPLNKLRTAKLKAWRNGLACGKSAQERTFRALKAALNLAVRNRRVSPTVAIEWKAVPAHRNADGRREIFLDLKQRRALLKAAKGGTRDLIEAAIVTGARPGELVKLKRSDFDKRVGTLKLTGKTGSRVIPLSDAAVRLFARLSKGKLPTAPLLTTDDGKPWTRSAIWSREVRAAAAAAGLPKGTTLYVLRHSAITEMLRSGMSAIDVARITGTSLQMLQDHYGQFFTDGARERLALLELV